MDTSKRFDSLPPNRQALLAVRLEKMLEGRGAAGDGDDLRLAACYVPKPGRSPTPAQLREFLAQRVPEYMLPEAYQPLDALPLTPNGKIDRRALSAPAPARQVADDNFVAPRTELEEELAEIWVDVLQVERVGVEDNFFDLGGHSLLATRLASRIRETFEVELSLRALFEAPTIAGLSVLIVQHLAAQTDDEEMALLLQQGE
jgi:acyl carrier protein